MNDLWKGGEILGFDNQPDHGSDYQHEKLYVKYDIVHTAAKKKKKK